MPTINQNDNIKINDVVADYVNADGDTMTGSLVVQGSVTSNGLLPSSDNAINIGEIDNEFAHFYVHNVVISGSLSVSGGLTAQSSDISGDSKVEGNLYVGKNSGGDSNIYLYDDNSNTWRIIQWDDSANSLRVENNSGALNKMFHEEFHPNADKLTTARTISLSGDVSGSTSFDGSSNVSITTTIGPDLVITAGDTDIASIQLYGSTQGTGMVYVGQSTSHGGGMVYNGDNTPGMATTTDAISFYRRTSGTDHEVFYYMHSSNDVNFKGNLIGPNGAAGSKVDGFEKVYNAVWNDIADFIEVEEECEIEYGKCYYVTKDFKHKKTDTYCQKGVLGIASDTFGYGLGKTEGKHQLPIAVGGFVLAYIDGNPEPGDALTSSSDGNLSIMSEEDLSKFPHRVVATYYKPENLEKYYDIKVDGRHWIKIK